jgi:hypothetical protein
MSNGPYRKSNPLAVDRELGDAAARCWICKLIFGAVIDLLRSRAMLEAEMLVLRQQIMCCGVPILTDFHLGRLTDLYWEASAGLFPKMYDALAIVRPGTVIRWHRAGFRLYWRWKSRRRCGRSPVSLEIRRLIREMSVANPLWGAPRIHGELLKLGIEIGQTSVAKYMARRRGPPSQGWKTFLRNHADGTVAMDPLRRADNLVRTTLWVVDHGPWPPFARHSATVSFSHAPSLADYITTIVGSLSARTAKASPRQGPCARPP